MVADRGLEVGESEVARSARSADLARGRAIHDTRNPQPDTLAPKFPGGEGGIGFALLRGFAPILADCLFGLKVLTEPKGSHPSTGGNGEGRPGLLEFLLEMIEPTVIWRHFYL